MNGLFRLRSAYLAWREARQDAGPRPGHDNQFREWVESDRPVRLVREAAVLGFVEGTHHAAGRTWEEMRADYPKDSDVLARVLHAAAFNRDLYPLLSRVDENPGGDRRG